MSKFIPTFITMQKLCHYLFTVEMECDGEMDDETMLIQEAYYALKRKTELCDAYNKACNEADRKFKALELDYNGEVDGLYTTINKQRAENDELRAEVSGAFDTIANKDADIEALYVELENLKVLENKQFQAKWNALTKLDDYQDTIDQLRADNDRLRRANDNLHKMVDTSDNLLWSIKQDLDNWSDKAEED